MSDIVERLRRRWYVGAFAADLQLHKEAADEIERLRALVEALPLTSQMVAENADMRTRLAAAEAVCEGHDGKEQYAPEPDGWWSKVYERCTCDAHSRWREVAGR